MICLNCGRPNPSGTSLCDRCRERRPGLERARGGVIYQRTRETARVRRRGSGILVGAVLFLAALIFAGGTLAVFMGPRGATPTAPAVAADPSASASRLEIFEQQTATPSPTPVPHWYAVVPVAFTDDRSGANHTRPVRHAYCGAPDSAGRHHATADQNASDTPTPTRDAHGRLQLRRPDAELERQRRRRCAEWVRQLPERREPRPEGQRWRRARATRATTTPNGPTPMATTCLMPRTTARTIDNPDQADNDGDGIGNACDNDLTANDANDGTTNPRPLTNDDVRPTTATEPVPRDVQGPRTAQATTAPSQRRPRLLGSTVAPRCVHAPGKPARRAAFVPFVISGAALGVFEAGRRKKRRTR